MADKNDVLAVLDQVSLGDPTLRHDFNRARAAVAEMAEQNETMRLALIKIGNGANGYKGRDVWMADVARKALAAKAGA